MGLLKKYYMLWLSGRDITLSFSKILCNFRNVVKEIKNANCHQIVKRPWATSFKVIDKFPPFLCKNNWCKLIHCLVIRHICIEGVGTVDWCHFAHEYQTCKSHKIQILWRGKNLAHNMAQQFKYEFKKQFQIFTVISINHFYCLSHSIPHYCA